jgi:hypothetical protein
MFFINLRAAMYKELAQYVAPKRKAVEVSGPDDGNVSFAEIVRRSMNLPATGESDSAQASATKQTSATRSPMPAPEVPPPPQEPVAVPQRAEPVPQRTEPQSASSERVLPFSKPGRLEPEQDPWSPRYDPRRNFS